MGRRWTWLRTWSIGWPMQPVRAYREPWHVKAGRRLRRHRQFVTAVVALLLAAVPLSLIIAVNRDRARREAEQAEQEIGKQKEIAETNEKTASEREAEIRAVLDFVETKLFAAARPMGREGGLGPDVTLRMAVEMALPYVAKNFESQPLIEARLRMTLGTSFLDLGEPKIAAEQFQTARSLYAEHLGPDHRDTLWSMDHLANSYYALGRHADGLKLHEEALALMKTRLGPDHPDTLSSMSGLAASYYALGRYADALKLREEYVGARKAKLGPDHPDTLGSMHNLANSYGAVGRKAESLSLAEETLARMKAKLGPDHPDTLWRRELPGQHLRQLGPSCRRPQTP